MSPAAWILAAIVGPILLVWGWLGAATMRRSRALRRWEARRRSEHEAACNRLGPPPIESGRRCGYCGREPPFPAYNDGVCVGCAEGIVRMLGGAG